jgi:hypothetical protein
MRLASVTFHGKESQVGGAQIPALAFKKWCDILGHESDYIDYYSMTDKTMLNQYDGVFFCNPVNDKILAESRLIIPFVSMIHAEVDKHLIIDNANDEAEAVVVIGENYWNFHNQILWYPCCFPEYLLKDNDVFRDYKHGLVYSARLSTVKNAIILASLTRYPPFMNEVEFVDVYGEYNTAWYKDAIESIDPNWNRIPGIYDISNFEATKGRLQKYSYFWDVSCIPSCKFEMLRLNLAAVEALKFGCIPIVDKRYTPKITHEFTIDLKEVSNGLHLRVVRDRILKHAHLYCGYELVKKQVKKIIGVFSENHNSN